MVFEDSQDNAEAVETLDSTPACSAPETTPADSAGATVARSASARFPRPMVVSPQLMDKPMSNSLDKILTLVSTQLLQKADKNDIIPMQMQMQQQQQQQQQQIQQQQNMMNMMMMTIMSSMLNHGTSQTTTSTTIVEPIQAMMNSMIHPQRRLLVQPPQCDHPNELFRWPNMTNFATYII